MSSKNRTGRRRKHRKRKSSLNSDLFDSDSDEERDKKATESLSPERHWRQLQFRMYLRERMRNGIRSRNSVWVDTMGRPVTLAERILRFKVLQQEKEKTTNGDDSQNPSDQRQSSATFASTKEDANKDGGSVKRVTSLHDLLAQYTRQREQEASLSSALLEEIVHAKENIQREHALQPRPDSLSISLGDSATNVNAKTRHQNVSETRRRSQFYFRDAMSATATPTSTRAHTSDCQTPHACVPYDTKDGSGRKSQDQCRFRPRSISGNRQTHAIKAEPNDHQLCPVSELRSGGVRHSVLSASYRKPEREDVTTDLQSGDPDQSSTESRQKTSPIENRVNTERHLSPYEESSATQEKRLTEDRHPEQGDPEQPTLSHSCLSEPENIHHQDSSGRQASLFKSVHSEVDEKADTVDNTERAKNDDRNTKPNTTETAKEFEKLSPKHKENNCGVTFEHSKVTSLDSQDENDHIDLNRNSLCTSPIISDKNSLIQKAEQLELTQPINLMDNNETKDRQNHDRWEDTLENSKNLNTFKTADLSFTADEDTSTQSKPSPVRLSQHSKLSKSEKRPFRSRSNQDNLGMTMSEYSYTNNETAVNSNLHICPESHPSTRFIPAPDHSVYYFISHRMKRHYTEPEILAWDLLPRRMERSRNCASRESLAAKVLISPETNGDGNVSCVTKSNIAGSNAQSRAIKQSSRFLPDIKLNNGISKSTLDFPKVSGSETFGYNFRQPSTEAIGVDEGLAKRAIGLHRELSTAATFCKRPAAVTITLVNRRALCDMRIDWGLLPSELPKQQTADLQTRKDNPSREICTAGSKPDFDSHDPFVNQDINNDEKPQRGHLLLTKTPELMVAGSLNSIKGLSCGISSDVEDGRHSRKPAEFLFVREMTLSRYVAKERLREEMRAYLEPLVEERPQIKKYGGRRNSPTYKFVNTLRSQDKTKKSIPLQLPRLPPVRSRRTLVSSQVKQGRPFDEVTVSKSVLTGPHNHDLACGGQGSCLPRSKHQRHSERRREKALYSLRSGSCSKQHV
ncbi:hypothetical protein RRG08_060890 [Elysia crispata]|uniref:Uncharacterized protein n=1 Tax=Elysia crispata TaxID=231223 RepID=A0AAE0ZFP1_9GAST|nr:hypothetical protein RRG08_060890 [Elysia crispata]